MLPPVPSPARRPELPATRSARAAGAVRATRWRRLALALAVGAAAAPPASAEEAASGPGTAPSVVERRREAIARELVRVGTSVQAEIRRGDVAALVARVPDAGLRCRGRLVPKARVARDLAAPGSWLHGVFFGEAGGAPDARAAPSLAALFRSGREIAVVVSFRRDPRAGAAGRPCLEFRAKEVVTPGAPLCFEERGGRWWFTESLYPCG